VTAGCAAITPTRGGTRAYYERLPPEALAAVFAAALLAFLGLSAIVLGHRKRAAFAGAATSALLAFGFIAAFSIGMFVAPFGLAAAVLMIRLVVLSPDRLRAVMAAGAGLAFGIGSMALWLAYAWAPLVECHQGGVSSSAPGGWWDRHASTGSASGGTSNLSGRDQVATGTIRAGDQVVSFRCEGGRLTEIHFQ
jgi:hypothetical protein